MQEVKKYQQARREGIAFGVTAIKESQRAGRCLHVWDVIEVGHHSDEDSISNKLCILCSAPYEKEYPPNPLIAEIMAEAEARNNNK